MNAKEFATKNADKLIRYTCDGKIIGYCVGYRKKDLIIIKPIDNNVAYSIITMHSDFTLTSKKHLDLPTNLSWCYIENVIADDEKDLTIGDKMMTEELSKFPHTKLSTQSNGSAEIYFTGLNTFEAVFDLMSFHRIKCHGRIKLIRDGGGYIAVDKSASEPIKIYRNDNNEPAEDKVLKRAAELFAEKAYSFCRTNNGLFVEAHQLARNNEINRLKDLLKKTLEENKIEAFDKIEQRLFELRYEQPDAPIVVLSNKELGIE